LQVRVPVLSEQITVTAPKVSIISKLLTRTLFFNILLAVNVSATVNSGKSPSGTLDTTIPIKNTTDSIMVYPFNKAPMKKEIPKTEATIPKIIMSLFISAFMRVGGLFIVDVDLAILPKKVRSPV